MQHRQTDDLKVPAARTAGLVTTESKNEVLVYDQEVHHIHHLNATAATVWRLCDGERTVSDIATKAGIAEDAVKLALRTLDNAQLLDGPLSTTMRGAQSRRTFMKKAAVAGVVPAIVSVTAASAQGAQSCVDPGSGETCNINAAPISGNSCQCCSAGYTLDADDAENGRCN